MLLPETAKFCLATALAAMEDMTVSWEGQSRQVVSARLVRQAVVLSALLARPNPAVSESPSKTAAIFLGNLLKAGEMTVPVKTGLFRGAPPPPAPTTAHT